MLFGAVLRSGMSEVVQQEEEHDGLNAGEVLNSICSTCSVTPAQVAPTARSGVSETVLHFPFILFYIFFYFLLPAATNTQFHNCE